MVYSFILFSYTFSVLCIELILPSVLSWPLFSKPWFVWRRTFLYSISSLLQSFLPPWSSANTSNDLAIARQIQEDLYQLEDEEPPSSGAVGTGLPPTAATAAMSKSNFESLRFLDDDPNYYGKGYDIGRGEIRHYWINHYRDLLSGLEQYHTQHS